MFSLAVVIQYHVDEVTWWFCTKCILRKNSGLSSNKLIITKQTALALELGREQELVCAMAATQDHSKPFCFTNTPAVNQTVSRILHLTCEGQG